MKRALKWSAGIVLVGWAGLWSGLRITEVVKQDHAWRLYSDPLIFRHPRVMMLTGALLDAKGRLVITSGDRVWHRTPDGSLTPYAGHEYGGAFGSNRPFQPKDGAGIEARFLNAELLAVDPFGNAYVQDLDLSRGPESSEALIRKVDIQGSVTTLARIPNNPPDDSRFPSLYMIQGAAADAHGYLYLAQSEPGIIWRMDPTGQFQKLAGKEGPVGYRDGEASQAQFHWLMGLALDRNGDLFVSDGRNRVIRRLGRDGQVSTFAGKAGEKAQKDGASPEVRFCTPHALVFAPSGDLIVLETRPAIFRSIGPDGSARTLPIHLADGGAPNSFRIQLSVGERGEMILFQPGLPTLLEEISPDGKVRKLLDTGKSITALY